MVPGLCEAFVKAVAQQGAASGAPRTYHLGNNLHNGDQAVRPEGGGSEMAAETKTIDRSALRVACGLEKAAETGLAGYARRVMRAAAAALGRGTEGRG